MLAASLAGWSDAEQHYPSRSGRWRVSEAAMLAAQQAPTAQGSAPPRAIRTIGNEISVTAAASEPPLFDIAYRIIAGSPEFEIKVPGNVTGDIRPRKQSPLMSKQSNVSDIRITRAAGVPAAPEPESAYLSAITSETSQPPGGAISNHFANFVVILNNRC